MADETPTFTPQAPGVQPAQPAPAATNPHGGSVFDEFSENAAAVGGAISTNALRAEKALQSELGKLGLYAQVWFVGALVTLVSCFLPWWGISSVFPQAANYSVNAFSGATYFPGIVLFLGALFFLLLGTYQILGKSLPAVIEQHRGWVTAHLAGSMVLIALIILSIYTTPEYTFTNAQSTQGMRFGLVGLLAGVVILALGVALERTGGQLPFLDRKPTSVPVQTAA